MEINRDLKRKWKWPHWHLNVKEKSQDGEWCGASLLYAYYAEIGRFIRAMSTIWNRSYVIRRKMMHLTLTLDPGSKCLLEVFILLEWDWRAHFGSQYHFGSRCDLAGEGLCCRFGSAGGGRAGRGSGGCSSLLLLFLLFLTFLEWERVMVQTNVLPGSYE